MSLKKSCSCRFFVPVEIMTRFPERITGRKGQVALFFDGGFDRLRHLQLPAAKFIGRMRLRQHSAGREELVERESRASRYGMRRGAHRVSIIQFAIQGIVE